ncbi:hypothetical protein NQ176_g7630 [Zarea fungicola]|uniref:Uncharacterized protein n=1 Tax=Zarea fungicola TaxID=93591 RepID=A0ACC1MX05_9HYPO|nr:hypothetical protein NQ176_g7630 [Lecanicillium fungicola]
MQSNSPRNSDLQYLLPVVETSPRHSAITTAVNVVALATWANVRLSPKAMLKAQSEYTIALAETNKALKCSVRCRKDETLALVVLLSIYEVIACTDEAFMGRWIAHLDGATQLIELRGPEQLTRLEGLSLFIHLRAQIALSRIFQEKPNPPILARLTDHAAACRSPDDAVLSHLASVVMELADLCAELKTNREYHHKDVICDAMRLDSGLFLAVLDAPKRWHYRTLKVPVEDGKPIIKGIWGEEYHEYNSLGAAKMWNNYRSARIVIMELIIDIVKERDLLADAQYAFLANQCRQTLKQLVEDICASVPFYFGWCLSADEKANGGGRWMEGTGNNGLALMWPILVAGNSGIASEEQQEWIAVCLDKIGHSMGINQAFSMARLLRERKRSRSWLTG